MSENTVLKLKKDKQGTYFELKVDPYQGAAGLACSLAESLQGYEFIQVERKGRNVKIYVEKCV